MYEYKIFIHSSEVLKTDLFIDQSAVCDEDWEEDSQQEFKKNTCSGKYSKPSTIKFLLKGLFIVIRLCGGGVETQLVVW